ncbi:sensor histidine kinase [Compostimonas suwonensis]|uniref:histidine kinase n=1 Tax=Compostimonas suwonensis TaxID=1048394 RepID=A0A2M9BCT2_9MICO|nr:sensor histidine kinase [Compostimonas suwonensis]PJJ55753.1 signal transduction histidine kinase [Compostimonas suwonensis]
MARRARAKPERVRPARDEPLRAEKPARTTPAPTKPARARKPRGRLRRWFRTNRRVLLAGLVVLGAIVLLTVEAPLATSVYGVPAYAAIALSLLHTGALPLALWRPRLAAAVGTLAALALILLGTGAASAPWPWPVASMIVQTALIVILGLRAPWLAAVVTWLAGVAVAGVIANLLPGGADPGAVLADVVVFTAVTGAALGVGITLRLRQNIRAQLVQEQELTAEEHAKRLLAEEKTRIARELHDVIAHSMSMINVQASTAVYRHPSVDPVLAAEFDDIAASSRQALAEMRGLLNVLRDAESAAELAPQPRLSDIPGLVERAERAGVTATLDWSGERDDEGVSEVSALTAYRIVQEALSNVIRHAPGADVAIRCVRDAHDLSVSVSNSAPPRGVGTGAGAGPIAPAPARTGHGLRGMRERAASVGGTVSYGPAPDGGFEVHAVVPLRPASGTAEQLGEAEQIPPQEPTEQGAQP